MGLRDHLWLAGESRAGGIHPGRPRVAGRSTRRARRAGGRVAPRYRERARHQTPLAQEEDTTRSY